VFGISAAVGLTAGLDVPGKLVLAILAAILPAVTTALSAYEGLYAFERIAKLYRDAARNLRRVEAPRLADAADERAAVAKYVAGVEQIFTNERGQWGQLEVEPRPSRSKLDGTPLILTAAILTAGEGCRGCLHQPFIRESRSGEPARKGS
jgi:hypothetical protein